MDGAHCFRPLVKGSSGMMCCGGRSQDALESATALALRV